MNQARGGNTIAHNPVHHTDVLRKPTARGLADTRGRAHLFVLLALRKGLLAAIETSAAGDVVERHYAMADRETAYPGAHTSHRTGHLMPKHPRRSVRSAVNLFQVRPADPAGIEAHQHLTGTDLGNRHCLCCHLIRRAIDRGAHRAWNRLNHNHYPV